MARQRYGFDEAKIERYIKEGRGLGEGSSYKPWLTVQDVPSTGRSTRISGWKAGRVHHFLSDLETRYFYLVEWSEQVFDIREQYPLPRSDTQDIANQLGIRHPLDPKTKIDIVVTTDFLLSVTTDRGTVLFARAIKPAEQLNDRRVIEKLQIERQYWENIGIDWGIVTDKDIDVTVAENIARFHKYKTLSSAELPDVDVEHLIAEVLHHLSRETPKISHTKFCSNLDKALAIPVGSTLTAFSHLIATKQIRVPLDIPIKSTTLIHHFQPSNIVKNVNWRRG